MGSNIRPICEASCDTPGCKSVEIVDVQMHETFEQVVERLEGWAEIDGRLHCPSCALNVRVTIPGAHAAADFDEDAAGMEYRILGGEG